MKNICRLASYLFSLVILVGCSSMYMNAVTYAVKNTNDQAYLANVAQGKYPADIDIRLAALERINDQEALVKIALEVDDVRLRSAALERVTDQSLLAKVALESQSDALRISAVKLLTDQATLAKIALDDQNNLDIRRVAVEKLDKSELSQVADKTNEAGLLLAAQVRLGKTTWQEAIREAQENPAKVGDFIAGVALADTQPAITIEIVALCHNYIRKGDTKRIPDLKDLLFRYGDLALAEDYLNCGNVDLSMAARGWAMEHGYSVGTGSGSHRVTWGSSR